MSSLADPRIFNELQPASGAGNLAQKVFNIPELLENILLYLPVPGLLRVQSTCKATNSEVNASQKIEAKTGLRKVKNGWSETLPEGLPGVDANLLYTPGPPPPPQPAHARYLPPRQLPLPQHNPFEPEDKHTEKFAELIITFSTGLDGNLP